ncbi:MFS transporter [Natronomonas salsuginis]|uniref:MFS transporter n=2 Tax=Natronomonas salsuginis TaxID=2217661 RepID=A0A4U5JFX3_9EURY|nr:MFS transporter [Natronomonas salsuginis]
MVARLVISPVVPQITADFAVSKGAVGLALSGMWAAYAVSQFPSGILSDRLGERRVILAALGLTASTSVLLALAPSYPVFAITAVVLGAGAGLHYSVATSFFARHFDQVGRAIGIHVTGAPIAGLVAPVAAAAVGVRYGWRPALLLGAAVAIPIFALFWLQIDRTPPARPDVRMRSQLEIGPLRELLGRPQIRYTMLLSVGGAFSWQATASFLPTFLIEHHGYSAAGASLLFSGYFVVHGATQPLLGTLSDRFGRDGIAALAFGSGVVGYGSLVAGAEAVVLAAIPLVGIAMSWGAPVQSRFIDVLGASEQATGFGLVRTGYMMVGALGSVVVGTLADVFGWQAAFGAVVAVLVFECLLAVLLTLRDRP